ncbi:ABC transporter ATP-binding protein [Trichococcus sp. K1Tr]|uniref:ABC transporter ATP-binding protein n=1 Tax=Trichococcus sp. K1Tr TaxID=3020847 RepID=UPI00232A9F4F|nr:ABC transporter ATP-binding protein [Trichococcus sp. K1Tr]MDB6354252.1 ABC transporter ATP-binding protein [Trichococcus sp. K1Tr]
MNSQKSLIELRNVSMDYGNGKEQMLALERIDLTIAPQDFVCVLGPSGCGKSTLLKIIAGYQQPTTGEATFQGNPIQGPDWNRGVVFQTPTLYPWLSVKDNVGFGPNIRGLGKKAVDQISNHFLEQIGLLKDKDKAVFELSGGMRQRVALARVLANRPELILMDEPLGALDALTRLNMQTLIRDLWQENKNTVLMITHDVDEALSLGNRVIVMSKQPGKIIKTYELDYTHKTLDTKSNRVNVDAAYLEIKNEILDLINTDMDVSLTSSDNG